MSDAADPPSNAASDVAPAILGLMRRTKSGALDWRDQGRRSLEATAASWVVRDLEQEGHHIRGLWSPDYDRERRPELQTRPDVAMALDGAPAALDVTMFTTASAGWASGRAVGIRRAIEARLTALADPRSVLGLVRYERDALSRIKKPQRQNDTAVIVGAFGAAVAAIDGEATSHRIEGLPSWVRGASVTVIRPKPGREKRSISVDVLPSRDVIAEQVDQFIAERIESKGSQMTAWGRGILVIFHGFYEDADDLKAGFGRVVECPWWRVYWVPSEPPPMLVWPAS